MLFAPRSAPQQVRENWPATNTQAREKRETVSFQAIVVLFATSYTSSRRRHLFIWGEKANICDLFYHLQLLVLCNVSVTPLYRWLFDRPHVPIALTPSPLAFTQPSRSSRCTRTRLPLLRLSLSNPPLHSSSPAPGLRPRPVPRRRHVAPRPAGRAEQASAKALGRARARRPPRPSRHDQAPG